MMVVPTMQVTIKTFVGSSGQVCLAEANDETKKSGAGSE